MLQIVCIITLSVHLLLVGLAMGGPLACVWLEWRAARRTDPLADRVGRALARWSIGSLIAGMALGGVLLAMRWWRDDRAYLNALAAIPASRLWFGGAELVFSLVCLVAYVLLWDRMRGRRLLHRLLAIAAASNLLLHFPALFTIISVLSRRPELWGEVLDRAGYQRMLIDGEVMARVAHVWLAAFAVTGVAVMVLVRRMERGEAGGGEAAESEPGEAGWRLIEAGAWLALVPALMQLPAGFWLAAEIPEPERLPLLGGDLLTTGLFAAAVLLALWLMHCLAAIAMGDHEPRQISRCVVTLLLLVVLMVATRLRGPEGAARAAAPARFAASAPQR